ncbi:efflux RND transporter periplasmic adaptor subunit [Salinisphaera aquimarina]
MPAGRAFGLRVVCALAVMLALTACGSSSGEQQQPQQPPPIPVDVTTVQPHTVDVYAEYPGRVEGKRTVQVLARVEGILEKRHYTEGQVVKEGQLLYSIDPKPFQATVNQRKAELASANASLNQAQRQYNRVQHLYKVNAVSAAERDQALSDLETSRAAVQQAKANLDSAQIDLGYTKVNAPLTGATSLREIDEGSLVSNGTQLTTITQLDPVYVLFALPEDDAIARGKALSEMGSESSDEATREATIILPNGQPFPVKGVVDFTQSTINPDTGTVQLRAVVKNTNNALMPGRYVRARVRLETRKNALVVPNIAISDGRQSTQVYVVKNGKAEAVDVELGPDVEGGRLINKGLSANDKVIISGLGQVKPDAPVQIKQAQNEGSAPAGAGDATDAADTGSTSQGGRSAVADIDDSTLRLKLHELAADAPLGEIPSRAYAAASVQSR